MTRKKTNPPPDNTISSTLAKNCIDKAANRNCDCLNLLYMAMVFTYHANPRTPLREFIAKIEEVMPEADATADCLSNQPTEPIQEEKEANNA